MDKNLKVFREIVVVKKVLILTGFFISFISFSQDNLYASLSIPEELTQNANAVIRLNELNITINSKKDLNIVEKRIVTVLNEKGNAVVKAFSGYDRYYKIKKIEVEIYNAIGTPIKRVKKKDFRDQSAVDGGTLYSDSRYLFLDYTPMSYPYTVEFICEIETSNTAGIPSWKPVNQYFVSIEKDIYTLKDNADLGLRFKEKNLDEYGVGIKKIPNTLSYKLENNPAIRPEYLSPSLSKFTPQVLVALENFHFYGIDGKAKNWLEFGNWINNALLAGRNNVTEETRKRILDLTKNIQDPILKAKEVFEYVQNNTRYVSVQVGIGGIQPIPALEVDQLKYGDCKGLTNYTKSLLAIAGVDSYYSVVEAGNEIVDFEDDFASLQQGNHIILGIPDNEAMIWLDCTSQTHPFNFIGNFTDNRNVLVVKPESSEILKTTKYADSKNRQSTYAEIKLNPDGSIESKVKISTNGIQYDHRFGIQRQDGRKILEYYKAHWDYVNNLEVVDYKFDNDQINIEFTEELKIVIRDYASNSGDRMLIVPNIFNKNQSIPTKYVDRKLPLVIQRGFLEEDEYLLTIPNGYQVEAMPKNLSINNKFGEYDLNFYKDDDKLILKRTLLMRSNEYPNEDYDDYRDFSKQIMNADNSVLLLKKIS